MGAVKISDVIVPDVFNPYVIERTAELSELVQAGIISQDANLNTLARTGGKLINMPFWGDLTGADEVLSDSGSLTPGKISAHQDVAVLLMRGRAWGVNDLAKALSGDDPMRAVGDLVAAYWARREQAILIATLAGVFADNLANDAADLIADVSIEDGNNAAAGNLINGSNVVDAAFKLGDAQAKLTAIAMHSTVFSRLVKNNLIVYLPETAGTTRIATFMDRRVIVDDGCTATAAATSGYKYTSYLFGAGAIGRGEGAAPVPVETDRDSLAGEDYLINRRHFLLHPRGIAFQSGSVAGSSPTNVELATASNWSRVWEKKNVRIVKLVTNG
jgi:hypothetical protein